MTPSPRKPHQDPPQPPTGGHGVVETPSPWSTWLHQTRDYVAHLDPRGRLLEAGGAFRPLLRDPQEDPASRISPPAPWRQALAQVRTARRPLRRTLRVQGDGGLREVEFQFLPLLEGKDLTGILAQGRDVTELRQLQRERAQNQDLRTLGYMTSGVVHDLQNLFAVVLGSLDMAEGRLRAGRSGEQDLSRARRGALRARALASQVLRQTRGGKETRCLFPPTLTVEEVLDFLLPLTRGSSLHLASSEEAHRALVWGAPGEIGRIVLNLCVNAFQALEARPGRVEVGCSVEELKASEARKRGLKDPGPAFVLTVQDDGPGIPREVQDRIFQRGVSFRPEGHGLGLGVVQDLVRDLGGGVWVRSVPGEGAAFSVALPVRGWTDPRDREETPRLGNERVWTLLSSPWGELYGGLLSSWGYDVTPFESAAALVRRLGDLDPSADLLLLEKPDEDASALNRALSGHPRLPRILLGSDPSTLPGGGLSLPLPASRTDIALALAQAFDSFRKV